MLCHGTGCRENRRSRALRQTRRLGDFSPATARAYWDAYARRSDGVASAAGLLLVKGAGAPATCHPRALVVLQVDSGVVTGGPPLPIRLGRAEQDVLQQLAQPLEANACEPTGGWSLSLNCDGAFPHLRTRGGLGGVRDTPKFFWPAASQANVNRCTCSAAV